MLMILVACFRLTTFSKQQIAPNPLFCITFFCSPFFSFVDLAQGACVRARLRVLHSYIQKSKRLILFLFNCFCIRIILLLFFFFCPTNMQNFYEKNRDRCCFHFKSIQLILDSYLSFRTNSHRGLEMVCA